MTTTTSTGYEAIGAYTQECAYLPFESLLFIWMKPQKVLVVMEAEFWYLLFTLAKRRGAKTVLMNARMSDRSYPKYQQMRWLYQAIFRSIDVVYAQSVLDKERLESLGARNVQVTGNIKLSHLPKPSESWEKPQGFIVCGASTHEHEEPLILEAFGRLKQVQQEAKLLLVPRHPERFDKVSRLVEAFAKQEGVSWHRYAKQHDFESDIVVMDLLGKLVDLYAVSDLVILGGAFEPIGGHNAAEAAQFGCKIISGKHYYNQRDIFGAIEGIAIVEASNLSHRVLQHRLLKPTVIKTQTDISPIIETLKEGIMEPKE